MQSTSLHVAIIMDGNGRWAQRQNLPRGAGHRAGAEAVRVVTEAAPALGIRILTLYAFSSDNWDRPRQEVAGLFDLLRDHLRTELPDLRASGVRLSVIGRRDRLPLPLRAAIAAAERATAAGRSLDLRLAIDYSARDQIVRAAGRAAGASRKEAPLTRERFVTLLGDGAGRGTRSEWGSPAPDVDLLIRTGGEQRLSDFLLWESAYAELLFTPTPWPEFGQEDLARAVAEYHQRERRFGRVEEPGARRAEG
jgi:undecaprenyl diphosphate synthase